jgi:hypothetical protein
MQQLNYLVRIRHSVNTKLFISFVIPALRQALDRLTYSQAGIQLEENAFCLNPLDSRLRGNDGFEEKFRLTSKRLAHKTY